MGIFKKEFICRINTANFCRIGPAKNILMENEKEIMKFYVVVNHYLVGLSFKFY